MAMKERLLMVPGPTNLSKSVRAALAQPQVGHTDPEFVKNFAETIQLARKVLRNSKGYQFVFTGTGTVGMEAAVAATVEPGDKVLVLNTGYFGQRMVDINRVYGADVEEIPAPFGQHVGPDAVRRRLASAPFKALYVTHVDTGTTVCNPVAEIVREAKKAGVTALVDGVCSFGGLEFDFDKIGADVAFTGSQKALAAPPGAVLIAVSADFLSALEKKKDRVRTYYANLLRWKAVMDEPKNYFATHAVQLMQALNVALKDVEAEGLAKRWRRHAKNAKTIRDGIEKTKSKLVAEAGYRADTVTGLWTEPGAAPAIQKSLRDDHGIDVARGLGENNTKMLRVGHFGNLTDKQARYFVDSFADAVASSRQT
ncbi:MAG TPA: alanine--glyoxylate aminotransferase family protein [Nitrososphaerales archaeon]|nr:alanine--glyoxylate aminotransferase family protein [Nitrososphaerales archaeon]HUK75474.1 alanine--glyoxylate aminotransferase family protein [Nitrososphaerales archaeon]